MQFSKITISLLLALPTAFAISLGDIESLNKNEVNLGCLNTYNREVNECSQTEISSKACSSDCNDALIQLGKDIMLACRQAYAGPDTLLRKIIDGGLSVTLCKTTVDNTSSEEKDVTSTSEEKDVTSTSEVAKDDATTTSSAPAETSVDATETVTSASEEPTGAANTDSSASTDAAATNTTSETGPASATKTPGSDDSILGDNAAGRVGVGMGVIFGTVIAGVVSML